MSLWVTGPLGVTCWTTLYFVLKRRYSQCSSEWISRLIAVTHAMVVVPACAYASFVQGPNAFTHPGGPITPLQVVIINTSMSYFIFDFIWCLYNGSEGPVMLAHHFLSVFGTCVTLIRGTCGTEMCATLFGAEISNPFLQLRYFLRQYNMHTTWYGEANDLLFMALFGFMRTVIGTYFVYLYVQHPRPDLLARSGAFVFYCIGVIWWLAILQYAFRKYTKMYRNYTAKRDTSHIDYSNGLKSQSNGSGKNGYVHSKKIS